MQAGRDTTQRLVVGYDWNKVVGAPVSAEAAAQAEPADAAEELKGHAS